MNHKNSFIGIFLLSFIVFSFSFISASDDLGELLRNDVTQITVTVTQDESWVDFVFNPENAAFDHQEISLQNEDIGDIHINNVQLSFDISELFNDINGEVEIEEDSDIIQFNALTITGNGFINIIAFETNDFNITSGTLGTHNFIQNIVNGLKPGLDIDNLTAVNNHLAQNPLSRASDRHIIFTKNGNNYKLWNNKGYGDISDDLKTKIRSDLEEVLNINELFEENIVPFLEENGLASSLFDLNTNYTVEVDLSTIHLEDGIYVVPITISNGFVSHTKNINLVLQGIRNKEIKDTGNGTYTPTNPEVAHYLKRIRGLGVNKVSVSLFDIFSLNLPSNAKSVIKYIEINVSNNSALGGTIGFKVPVTDVSNPSLVSLYVLEGSNWVKLPTSLHNIAGGFYEYEAVTPHFSMFMIMETLPAPPVDNTPSTESSSGRGGTFVGGGFGAATPTTPTTPTPIEATPTAPTPGFFGTITGVVVGALGEGGALFALIFIALIVLLAVLAAVLSGRQNRVERRKGKKLNEEGDKDAT